MLRRPIERHTLKPFIFPKDFVLIQDSREQLPLFPENDIPKGLQIINKCLPYGDYSFEGGIDLYVIERKSLGDFYGYIGNQRDKTQRKMEEFREIKDKGGWVGLVIEATEDDIFQGYYRSQVPPEVARQSMVSFSIRSGVHFYFNRDRDKIGRWVVDHLVKGYRVLQEKEVK